MPFISQTDYDDIVFGVENDFDFIAASFTRTADDILQIRSILEEHGCRTINLIAKIENKQGVDNIDEIIRVSDGIMVARGDMGVEIPMEDVPVIQKMIIEKVYNAGKQVITATQMLDSMMSHPRPTRAETTDVANAVYDGTSAIMLSGETAAGQYPVEALKTMVKIATRTEQDINYASRMKKRDVLTNPDITNAIAHATCTTAMDLNASAIITVSTSGRTARMVSKYRPSCPIVGCSVYESVCRKLSLSWGVTPVLVDMQDEIQAQPYLRSATGDTAFESADFDSLNYAVSSAFSRLPGREQDVLRNVYYKEKTAAETADAMDVSTAYVYKLEKKGIRRMRGMLSRLMHDRK